MDSTSTTLSSPVETAQVSQSTVDCVHAAASSVDTGEGTDHLCNRAVGDSDLGCGNYRCTLVFTGSEGASHPQVEAMARCTYCMFCRWRAFRGSSVAVEHLALRFQDFHRSCHAACAAHASSAHPTFPWCPGDSGNADREAGHES